VATRRHPLRGFAGRFPRVHGFATDPLLHAATRFAGSPIDSQVSTGSRTHPWLHTVTASRVRRSIPMRPRVRGINRGYILSPLRGFAVDSHVSTGSRTHPWLHAATRFAGSPVDSHVSTGSRTHPWLQAVTRFAGCTPLSLISATSLCHILPSS